VQRILIKYIYVFKKQYREAYEISISRTSASTTAVQVIIWDNSKEILLFSC